MPWKVGCYTQVAAQHSDLNGQVSLFVSTVCTLIPIKSVPVVKFVQGKQAGAQTVAENGLEI